MGVTCSALSDAGSLFSSASIFCIFFFTSLRRCTPQPTAKAQHKILRTHRNLSAQAQHGSNTLYGSR